ncbi:azurin [Flavobacteriaceae sp. LMIT009]
MKTLKHLLLAVFSLALVACGGEEKKEKETKVKISDTKVEKKVDENVSKVVIAGNDMMKFDKTEIRVKAGKKVKLTLRHIGKMDVNVMGHNVVILKQGVDVIAFAAKAATEKANGYIPTDSKDVIAYTEMIGGGQTTTIEFDAPAAGEYDFICSFPAHYAMMKGKFIVE